MRQLVLVLALAMIALIGAGTVYDISHNGFNALDVLAILIIVLFTTGIVGALRNPPPSQ
jgi:hypothetical protein